jgi:predicted nuclease of restriction endonuclease-like (RecB) superfamily
MIEESKKEVAVSVNVVLTTRNWRIGKRVQESILQEKRAEYGKKVVTNLSKQLVAQFDKSWSANTLWHYIKFYEVFPDEQILSAVRRELTWTHIKSIMYIEDALKRDFYLEMCKIEKWSTRTLQDRIKSMLYERTALSKKPDETIKNDLEALKNEQKISADLVFKDPYFLDFLGLKDTFSEKDLENAILAELQSFLIELGKAFFLKKAVITIAFWRVRNASQ